MHELIKMPWRVGSVVTPSEGESFDDFNVAHLIYPPDNELNNWIRDIVYSGRRQALIERGEDSGDIRNFDFIRVVADEKGFVHWRWRHLIRRDNRLVRKLRHHGGQLGSPTIDTPIDQADRILDKILGFVVDERVGQRLGIDEEEKTILNPILTFPLAIAGLRAGAAMAAIPGEKAVIKQYLNLVNDVLRGQVLPRTTPKLQVLVNIRLDALRRQLSRKKAPSLQFARENLETFINSSNPEGLGVLTKIQGNFFDRLRELAGITEGVARRQIAMRNFRSGQEDYIGSAYVKLTRLLLDWQASKFTEGQLVDNTRMLIHSVEVDNLSKLVIQPFKDRTVEVGKLLDLEDSLTAGNFEKVARSLQMAAFSLHASERYTNRGIYGEPRLNIGKLI